MHNLAIALVDNYAQCWTCPVFDSLFAIISNSAAAAYHKLVTFGVIIFCVLFAIYMVNAIWENIKNGMSDPFLQKSVKPVIIKSLIALSLLSAGLIVPRLISTIMLEPVAQITLSYSESMLPSNHVVSETYQAIQLDDEGFFTPKLRDTILKIIKTSVSNFQVYIEVGIKIIGKAFSGMFGIHAIFQHIILCFIGIYLTYNFAKLFIKYSFCFMDIIVAMAMFAFFFPLSLIFFIFKDASGAPGWMKKLGGDLGSGQIKKLINAIISVGATILTYTIIMVIINGFLNNNSTTTEMIQTTPDSIFDFDLDNSTAVQITFAGAIVLVYVINYIAEQIPQITKKILSSLGVSQEDSLSKETGENVWKLTSIVATQTKNLAKNIMHPEANSEDKSEEKKEDKTENKKENK